MAYGTEERAKAAAEKVANALGEGWEIEVYSNLGPLRTNSWSYRVRSGNVQVYEYRHEFCAKIATESGGCVANESRANPLKAVQASIKEFRDHRDKTIAAWEQVEAELPKVVGAEAG